MWVAGLGKSIGSGPRNETGMVMAEAARRIALAEQPLYREAPNNIEAEQALLGAVLVNNDAFYRVSDFLKSAHFYEPLHRKIFDVAAELIRMGKIANPVTSKTFLPADEKVGDMTVAQYLARLAAEAVTVINAADYGRAIYDLATRRALITVGEDMVNIAYDAPVDMSPQEQIEDAERRLFELAETGRYDGGFESFTDAVKTAVDMANAAYMRDGHLSGIATGMRDLDRRMGGLQPSDLVILAGRPGMGKTSLATNIAFNIAHAYKAGAAGGRIVQGGEWRRGRLLLAGNVVGAARHPHHLRADRNPLVQNPARRDHRERFREAGRLLADDAEDPAVHRPDRRHLDCPAGGARAAAEAPARPRHHRHRLYPADARHIGTRRRRTAFRRSPRSPPD